MKKFKLSELFKLSFLFLSVLILNLQAYSQTGEKCFRGVVKDVNNAVIIGAEVLVENTLGKTIDRAETDENGVFRLRCFENGEYILTISKKGLSAVKKKINFVGESLEVSDIVLEVGSVAETVTVKIEPQFITSVSETATKTATPLRDVPQSVEIVNRGLLDSQAVRSLQDALYNVTAVSVAQGEGRRDQFYIRGFSAIGDQFIDGVRDDALYYRDLSNIEQIEVVKGPSAVLFGRGSSGGIINRVTKKPNVYERIGSAEIMFGSYGLKRGSFDYGQPIINEKLAFRFVGALEDSGSFREFYYQKRLNIAPSLSWKPTEKTDITFQFEYLNDKRLPDRGIPSFQGRPVNAPIETYYGFPEFDQITNKVNSQAIRFEHRLTNLWTIRNVFRRIGYDTNYYTTFPSGVSLIDGELKVRREQYNGTFDQTNYFNQTELVGYFETGKIRHTVLGGIELGSQSKNTFRTNNVQAAAVSLTNPVLTQPFNDGSARTLNNFQGNVLGIYLQDQIAFSKKWKALVGVRYDKFDQKLDDFKLANVDLERTDKQLSPRVGLVYQPNDFISVYTSYTHSFQPSGENLSLAVNNEELGPEFTKNYEAGIKATFQPLRLNATLAVFRLDRNNIKTNDPLNPGNLLLIGEQRTNGFELTISGSPLEKLDILAGYSLLDAQIIKSNNFSGGVPLEGNFAQLTPRNSGNIWITYELPKNLRLGFGGYARSRTFTSANNLVTLPGFVRLDASLAWKSEKHYEIAFNLRNIANRKYYETAHNDNQISPGSPINGSISLRYRW